jgi:hypothetical protein
LVFQDRVSERFELLTPAAQAKCQPTGLGTAHCGGNWFKICGVYSFDRVI